jgi:hypothetical protein
MSTRTDRTRTANTRIRTTGVLAAVPLAATAIVMSSQAAQAAENCGGTPATIVDNGGSGPLVGTEGRDVIVTHGRSVDARGGDDVVCGDGANVGVLAGPGDDVVDLASVKVSTTVELGAGADTFEGGNAKDSVHAATNHSPAEPGDLDQDVITTAGGRDLVDSGSATAANHDLVDVGEGDDIVTIVPGDGSLALGPGANNLRLRIVSVTPGTWAVHTNQLEVTSTAGVMRWTGGVARYDVDSDSTTPPSRLDFRGSASDDLVVLGTATTNLEASVRLRRGDDRLTVRNRTADGSNYALGRNHDSLVLNPFDSSGAGAHNDTVRVRLDQHRLDYGTFASSATLTSVDRLRVSGMVVRASGSFKREAIRVAGCDVRVRGGAGADLVKRQTVGLDKCQGGEPNRIAGGPGNDRLVGTPLTDDRLIGGRGARDVAGGRAGTDTCRAEVTRGCELS